jgi:repressor LexA
MAILKKIDAIKSEVPMQSKLTRKQQGVLEYLQRKIAIDGHAPSLRQTATELGVSHAAIAQILKALEEKGYLKRDGRYSRTIYLLNRARETSAMQRWQEILRGQNLFALRVKGDSMKDVGILNGDLAICEPRQYAQNGEIVVALINGEEATVKRFFLHDDHIELRPENTRFPSMRYSFGEVLIQGKIIGIQRGPEGVK